MPDKPAKDPCEPVIRLVNLTKRFGDRTVLDRLNLDIYPGETIVIMGGSGCGKSTLLRHMIGAVFPDEGHVEMLGRNLNEITEEEMDQLRLKFGILFQSGALFNSLSVGQNVALPLQEHTPHDATTIGIVVLAKLEQVGLRHAVDYMPAELSGGMKKRAGLARAIAMDPEILFYDEPSAGLDPVTSAEIDHLIMDLAGKLGVTSVVVTHEMDSAFRIADRMVMLDKGRVLKVGPMEQFRDIRDAAATGDETTDTIRQFLRGESEGPISRRQGTKDYLDDIMRAAEEP